MGRVGGRKKTREEGEIDIEARWCFKNDLSRR